MSLSLIMLIVACIMFFIAGFRKLVFNPDADRIDWMNLGFAFVTLSWIVA